ncbi:MAG: endolytic transglycosylase MltG [Gemmatimonadota bacterium]|nr:endolytic transglycosylase MltG [Gemmatimonadota bacterium]MDH5197842.1 endolytic transglycosylase MltG [Gemmatimonadota bacterium]
MSARPLFLAGALALGACSAPPPSGEPVRITIPRGATLGAVADTLHAYQIVESPRWFRLYATVRRRDRAIQAGVYDFYRHRPVSEVLAALVSGRAAYQRLVIPEGLMLTEIAAEVERQLGVPAESLLAATRDTAIVDQVAPGAASLEGYLYPSTYFIPVPPDARAIVAQMVREFETRWEAGWTARLDTLGLTRHQVVTLASIIEGEVRRDRDRAYVSSVYHNRLRAGWRLQADPTVIYALGRRRRLYERDYLRSSPYNTYLNDGLPPGPIGQPSAASIAATLYPASTDFFFLVAQADGHHIFSRTLAEHRAAVDRVQGARTP